MKFFEQLKKWSGRNKNTSEKSSDQPDSLPPPPNYESDADFVEAVHDIRQGLLDMLNNGVLGSDKDVPSTEREEGAAFLPNLLHYDKARTHSQALNRIMQTLEDMPIISAQTKSDGSEGAKIYTKQKNHRDIVSVSPDVLDPYARSLGISVNLPGFTPDLKINFTADDLDNKSGQINIWRLDYFYGYAATAIDSTSTLDNFGYVKKMEESFGAYALNVNNPAQAMLVNFVFSRYPLEENPGYLASGLVDKRESPFLSIVDKPEQKSSNFRTIDFTFDVEAAIAHYEEVNVGNDEQAAHGMREKKEFIRNIQIVNVGKVKIRGQDFFVYTGAERPLAKETKASPAALRETQRSPQGLPSPRPTHS